MSNEYYTKGNTIQPYTLADARDVAAEFSAIEAAFDKLPSPEEVAVGSDAGLFGRYRETLTQAVIDFAVGDLFMSDETGAMLIYRRISAAPGYEATSEQPFALAGDLVTNSGWEKVGGKRSETGTVYASVKKRLECYLHVLETGCVDNPSIDMTAQAQAAIDLAATVGAGADLHLYSQGMYGALAIPSNVSLIGQKRKTKIVAPAGSYTSFTINGSDARIENVELFAAQKTGGKSLALTCGTNALERIWIENFNTWDDWSLLEDSGSGAGTYTDFHMNNVRARRHRGPGMAVTRAFAYCFIDDVTIDHVGVSASDYTAFLIDLNGLPLGAGGVILNRCHHLGTMGTYNNANQHSFRIRNQSAVWISDCQSDTAGGNQLELYNVNGSRTRGFTASLGGGYGVLAQDVTNTVLAGIEAFGRNYLGGAPANMDAIRIVSGCAGLKIPYPQLEFYTGHGINQNAIQAGPIDIMDPTIFNMTERALRARGASAFNVADGIFANNARGEYDFDNALHRIRYTQSNGGSDLVITGPAIG